MVLPRLWRCLKRTFQLTFGAAPDTDEDEEDNINNCAALQFQGRDNPDASHVLTPKRLCLASAEKNQHMDPSDMDIASLLPLKQLLTCNVCFDFAAQANQCTNGHLICLPCSARLEQVSFSTKDIKTSCTCPVCRVSLRNFRDGRGMQRCLLAEKLAAELPVKCRYCEILHPRKVMDLHQRSLCDRRPVACRNALLGCEWKGVSQELEAHLEHCQVWNQQPSDLVKEVHRRLQDAFSSTANRLHPWRGLLKILEDRKQMRFGRRFHGGLRMAILPFLLDRAPSQGSSVSFKSPLVCLSLVRKQSLWVQMSMEIQRKGTESNCGLFTSETTYKLEIRKSSTRPYFLRSNTERSLSAHPIYFSLISLKCLSLNGCEEGVDFVDSWHRYVDEPPSEGSDNATSVVENSTVGATPASSSSTSRNQYRIVPLPENEFDPLRSGVGSNNDFVEWISPDVLSTRDSVQSLLAFALDPILFSTRVRKASTVNTTRRERQRHSGSQDEHGASLSQTSSSSSSSAEEEEEVDAEGEEENDGEEEAAGEENNENDDNDNDDGDDDDDETIYLLAESFRVSRENVAAEGESNPSTEPAVSPEAET